jgi:hypothetical protein
LGRIFASQPVAARIAPEHKVILGDVFRSDVAIILHPCVATKYSPPFDNSTLQFTGGPGTDSFIQDLAGWTHKRNESIKHRQSDHQAVALANLFQNLGYALPLTSQLAETHRAAGADFVAVNDDAWQSLRQSNRKSSNVLCFDAKHFVANLRFNFGALNASPTDPA